MPQVSPTFIRAAGWYPLGAIGEPFKELTGATICYTTNGSMLTTPSTVYRGPLTKRESGDSTSLVSNCNLHHILLGIQTIHKGTM